MSIKCESRIVREFKRKKAECVWPEYAPQGNLLHNPNADAYPEVCGGVVAIEINAVDDPYYGGCSASLEVKITCSRCGMPYFPGRPNLDEEAIVRLAEKAIEQQQKEVEAHRR